MDRNPFSASELKHMNGWTNKTDDDLSIMLFFFSFYALLAKNSQNPYITAVKASIVES